MAWIPTIVWVLPLPVWPYANTVARPPVCTMLCTNGCTKLLYTTSVEHFLTIITATTAANVKSNDQPT